MDYKMAQISRIAHPELSRMKDLVRFQKSEDILLPRDGLSILLDEISQRRDAEQSATTIPISTPVSTSTSTPASTGQPPSPTPTMQDQLASLNRELQVHKKANEAFQKELREIGELITQVANGDLTQRAQIHPSEMYTNISTFKLTINTMMD